jgi:hypothetical protein
VAHPRERQGLLPWLLWQRAARLRKATPMTDTWTTLLAEIAHIMATAPEGVDG